MHVGFSYWSSLILSILSSGTILDTKITRSFVYIKRYLFLNPYFGSPCRISVLAIWIATPQSPDHISTIAFRSLVCLDFPFIINFKKHTLKRFHIELSVFKAFFVLFSVWGRNSKAFEGGGDIQRTRGGMNSKVTPLQLNMIFLDIQHQFYTS